MADGISMADYCPPSKRKRKTLDRGRFYSVERVIASRKTKEVSDIVTKCIVYQFTFTLVQQFKPSIYCLMLVYLN